VIRSGLGQDALNASTYAQAAPAPLGLTVEPVTRNAGFVSDNRAPRTHQTIEQRGLADVGTPHDGERETFMHDFSIGKRGCKLFERAAYCRDTLNDLLRRQHRDVIFREVDASFENRDRTPRLAQVRYYLDHREPKLAAAAIRAGLRTRPDDPDLLNALGVTLLSQGRFAEALEHCERALQIYDPERHRSIAIRFGTDHGVAAHGFASLSLCFLGDFSAGFEHVRAGLALARRLQNPFDLSYALLSETIAHWMHDDLEAERAYVGRLYRRA